MPAIYDILQGDVLSQLQRFPDESVNCVVTSPPYWGLRDYGSAGQIGLEATPAEFVAKMVLVFREVRRVLCADGTCWINMGDSYANDGKWGGETGGKQHYLGAANRKRVGREKRITGLKPKDLIGIPWRLAFALQEDGWWLRQDIIWSKANPMPESVSDRCTKAHEYVFLLSKNAKYYFDSKSIREISVVGQIPRKSGSGAFRGKGSNRNDPQGPSNREGRDMSKVGVGEFRNKRDVWEISTQPYKEAHFATFPEKLVEPCILAGRTAGGVVLDPFCGSGTVGVVARHHGRNFVGIELNPEYIKLAHERIATGAKRLA